MIRCVGGMWWWSLVVLCVGGAAAESERPRCDTERCIPRTSPRDELLYQVDGTNIKLDFLEGQYFRIECKSNITLDTEWLPKFNRAVFVEKGFVSSCPVPGGGYFMAFNKLNVTVQNELIIEYLFEDSYYNSSHFQSFTKLKILQIGTNNTVPVPSDDFLEPLQSLIELRLKGFPLTSGALQRLPVSLSKLGVELCGLRSLPVAALQRLRSLRQLFVKESASLEVPSPAAPLAELTVRAPLAKLPAPGELQSLSIWEAVAENGTLDGRCELRSLTMAAWRGAPAPGWLAECGRLQRLELWSVSGREQWAPPPGLLWGAGALQTLYIRFCNITTLPDDLLVDARELTYLDLSHNLITDLPRGFFSTAPSLQHVNLSYNRLVASPGSGVLAALGTLHEPLAELSLAHNKQLGDLCGDHNRLLKVNAVSVLSGVRSLRKLDISNASVTRLCPDWRGMTHLQQLRLNLNNITSISYSELQMERSVKSLLDLSGNPLQWLEYTRQDYRHLQNNDPQPQVVVSIDSWLTCDCRVYWLVRALQLRPRHLSVAGAGLRCNGTRARAAGARHGALLAELDYTALSCALPACPPPCDCRLRVHDNATLAHCSALPLTMPASGPRAPLVLTVRDANVTALPTPRRTDYWLELHMRGNRITDIPPDLLTDSLRVLDLANNSISRISKHAASLLMSGSRRVNLLGNPLDCECDAVLPAVLAAGTKLVAGLQGGELRCAGGEALEGAVQACGAWTARRTGLAVGLGSLAALAGAALLAAYLLRRRNELKALLAGVCGAAAGVAGEEERAYDAFVSFAHADLAEARALVARLERSRLRVCVHYRDWAPGAWIPEQIAASVAAARRTVVLVSAAWLRSGWARAEFRAAHADAVRARGRRLVAVLLPGAPRDGLDADLAAFLAANTYLEWGDPWFWSKLLAAMPRPPPAPRRRWWTRGGCGGEEGEEADTKPSPLDIATVTLPVKDDTSSVVAATVDAGDVDSV